MKTNKMADIQQQVIGTCMQMCPDYEMKEREAMSRLHFFERLPKKNHQKQFSVDRSRAVKEYSRPAAGKDSLQPTELRPAKVLISTCDYLIDRIVPSTALPWCRVYDFVFDRLRAVRQDMVIQRIAGHEAMRILEIIVRFHIYASYRLCAETVDNYDPQINDTHLQECLKRLLVLYASYDDASVSRRAEFIAYYLLVNLGDAEALTLGLQYRKELGADDIFKLALAASLSWWNDNQVRTFRLIRSLPGLHLCAFHRHLNKIRSSALRSMSAGFSGKNLTYPLPRLSDLLLFDSQTECARLCSDSGLEVSDDRVSFTRANYHLPTTGTIKSLVHPISKVKKWQFNAREAPLVAIIPVCATLNWQSASLDEVRGFIKEISYELHG